MSVCGVPVIDGRHGRVDFTLTLGEGWETQVCAFDLTGAPIDLTGRTFNAGLMTLDGVEVFDLLPVVSGNCVSLHVAGADTEEEPLGLGVWSWFLREIVPVDEAEYWVGGSFSIYPVNSYSSGGACGPDVVEVCLDSTVNVSVGYRVAGSDVEVVASDAATGRYALQGPNGPLEQGDTGWRTIASWTAGVQDGTDQIGTIDTAEYAVTGDGNLDIRRTGNTVMLRMNNANGNDLSKTNAGSLKLKQSLLL